MQQNKSQEETEHQHISRDQSESDELLQQQRDRIYSVLSQPKSRKSVISLKQIQNSSFSLDQISPKYYYTQQQQANNSDIDQLIGLKRTMRQIKLGYVILYSSVFLSLLMNIVLITDKQNDIVSSLEQQYITKYYNIHYISSIYFVTSNENCQMDFPLIQLGEYPGLQSLCICPEQNIIQLGICTQRACNVLYGFNKQPIYIYNNIKWCIKQSNVSIYESLINIQNYKQQTCNDGYKSCIYQLNKIFCVLHTESCPLNTIKLFSHKNQAQTYINSQGIAQMNYKLIQLNTNSYILLTNEIISQLPLINIVTQSQNCLNQQKHKYIQSIYQTNINCQEDYMQYSVIDSISELSIIKQNYGNEYQNVLSSINSVLPQWDLVGIYESDILTCTYSNQEFEPQYIYIMYNSVIYIHTLLTLICILHLVIYILLTILGILYYQSAKYSKKYYVYTFTVNTNRILIHRFSLPLFYILFVILVGTIAVSLIFLIAELIPTRYILKNMQNQQCKGIQANSHSFYNVKLYVITLIIVQIISLLLYLLDLGLLTHICKMQKNPLQNKIKLTIPSRL